MSLFDNNLYRWRETYFVFFEQAKQPTAQQVKEALQQVNQTLELEELKADDQGRFVSVTVMAPDAYAAIDIGLVTGEEVVEQLETLPAELKEGAIDDAERAKVRNLSGCDARLDLLHFEMMIEFDDDDEEALGGFDPGALLAVMEALTELVNGIGVDPAAATVM
ncbi:MAG: hypothetical protein GTO53_13635 [Planctomycetales bacterium]|nr:hypothetical protein [Planctomycetales bacterium]NIM10133.1 hypothetical protein [Planctomycetales bacterium]NIN08375.1 hypothetical protein [Planctomycetales bacterium]NIN77503.1 hypothetical protein [Planctomycetales bacterium]NIO34675.1 hypothetical protein [Planctomycetales bacterium]